MFKNKPVTLLITAGLLILLIAAAGVYPLISGNLRFASLGGANRPQMQGQVPGGRTLPSGGNLPSNTTPPEGFQPGNGQFTQGGRDGNFTGTMPTGSTTIMKLMQLLRIVQTVGAILITIFAVLAILGILLGKNWGRKLAVTSSILAILFTMVGMFGFMMGLSLWIKIAVLAISIAIIVFSLLPKSRQMATVPA